ncbi:MAG TPA: tetratricopeptide repeat protein [Firmicutes bacterium]|nr:tetratricopeptide repeat protein [Bacillota bacterium]
MKKLILFFTVSLLFSACTTGQVRMERASLRYGYRLYTLGLYDEAQFHFETLLKQDAMSDQERARILNNLAVIYEMRGEYQEARETYREALTLDSNHEIYENYKRFTGGL